VCGRFTLTSPAEIVAEFFGLAGQLVLTPRFNIAPTQTVLIVRESSDGKDREAANLQWGLVPSWAKDPSLAAKLINARGETVAEKPSFRRAFRQHRCRVVADGFYEWKAAAEKGAAKEPHWISSADGGPMGFAGIWEEWQPANGEPLRTCAIITTSANSVMEPIHARMPVILEPSVFTAWLDTERRSGADLDFVEGLMRPCDPEHLATRRVSTHVNSPRNDDSRCIEAIA
jgi:putative SOS response-associated peptidase YedK